MPSSYATLYSCSTIHNIICILQNEDELEDSMWKQKQNEPYLCSIGSQYLVAIERKLYFSDDSALLSMINLFSSFYCFNLSYPASLKPFYYFLEQYIFKVTPSMPPPAIVTRVLSTFKHL